MLRLTHRWRRRAVIAQAHLEAVQVVGGGGVGRSLKKGHRRPWRGHGQGRACALATDPAGGAQPEEVTRLLGAVTNLKHHIAPSAAYGAELRASEVIGLKGHRRRQSAVWSKLATLTSVTSPSREPKPLDSSCWLRVHFWAIRPVRDKETPEPPMPTDEFILKFDNPAATDG